MAVSHSGFPRPPDSRHHDLKISRVNLYRHDELGSAEAHPEYQEGDSNEQESSVYYGWRGHSIVPIGSEFLWGRNNQGR
jgi:hypothetical protein